MFYIVCEGTTYTSGILTDTVNKWKNIDLNNTYIFRNQCFVEKLDLKKSGHPQ
jgi:hypothetical protein